MALLCALAAALWVSRDDLGHQLSQGTERARLLDSAAAALVAGELTRPDGHGAAELYGAVLAQDPDHPAARDGLMATGRAALVQARAALADGQPERVLELVELARRLSVPEAELEPVVAAHRRLGSDEQSLAGLLDEAQRIRRTATPDVALEEALPIYDQALAMAPGNRIASSGRTRLLDDVLRAARADIDAGQGDRARRLVERVAAADPGHLGLPPVRARLAEVRPELAAPPRAQPEPAPEPPVPERVAATLTDAEVDQLLDGFNRALADEQLLEPPGASAWDVLRRLHAGAPDDPRSIRAGSAFRETARDCFERHLPTPRLSAAEACLEALQAVDPAAASGGDRHRRLASRWIGLAEERLGAAERAGAMRAYESARALDPSHPALAALAARLEMTGGR